MKAIVKILIALMLGTNIGQAANPIHVTKIEFDGFIFRDYDDSWRVKVIATNGTLADNGTFTPTSSDMYLSRNWDLEYLQYTGQYIINSTQWNVVTWEPTQARAWQVSELFLWQDYYYRMVAPSWQENPFDKPLPPLPTDTNDPSFTNLNFDQYPLIYWYEAKQWLYCSPVAGDIWFFNYGNQQWFSLNQKAQ